MAHRKLICVFAVVLALWAALSPMVFAMPVAAMAAQMSASADCASGDCDCCPNPAMDRNFCAFACVNAMFVLNAPDLADVFATRMIEQDWFDGAGALDGRSIPPEPPPPKPASLQTSPRA